MIEASQQKRFKTRSVDGTMSIAQNIAELLMPLPRLVVLRGELGAGKTTLVKGIAAALGVADPQDVTSPTFTLVHEYSGTKARIYHLDLYRLESERDLSILGIEEMAVEPNTLVLVEWGDKFASILSLSTGEIAIENLGGDERIMTIRSGLVRA